MTTPTPGPQTGAGVGSQTTDGSTAAGSNSTTSRVFGTAVGAD